MLAYTVITVILWVASAGVHLAMFITFTLLLIGFILLDIGKFWDKDFIKIAGYELMVTAFAAFYMMASVIYAQVFGRNILPLGPPLIPKP